MARVRTAAYAALLLVLLVAATAAAAIPRSLEGPLAAVGWPPSTGLVVAELVTGGASASDEYVEVANAGFVPADLSGLEIAYATSSGASVTKKAAWAASLVLAPGQHLLLANGAGAYASIADAVYTTGLAGTGGAIVLRVTGGAVVDAVGWGDATNAFVEGLAAPAAAAGQSIERLPGAGGNSTDTNANRADFVVNPAPVPQNLASEPVLPPSASPLPSPVDSPIPTATASPSATPIASATPEPLPSVTATPVPTPTASPTDSPAASPTAAPSPTASPLPTQTASPTAAPTETPSPTPSPTAGPLTIAAARALPDGSSATIEGLLTTALGALESGRTGFVQDPTGGIALYLDAAYDTPIPAGTRIHVTGVLGSRYGERTLRLAGADLAVVAAAGLPAPLDVTTGAAGEALEGLRLRVTGVVIEAPTSLADGLGVTIDDGSGPLRLVVAPGALADAKVATGMTATAIGPLGQRDSSGTGASGYRLSATLQGEFAVQPAPTPSRSAPPSTSPAPTRTPTPTSEPSSSATSSPAPSASLSPSPTAPPSPAPTTRPSPTVQPTASPTTTPQAMTVGQARSVPVGGTARVRGVVTAEAGRLGTPSVFAIGDASGGLPVRLAAGMAAPVRGTLVEVLGVIAAPYGQTELRLLAGRLTPIGTSALPAAQTIAARSVGEAVEGRLVRLSGTVSTGATKSTSGDLVLVVTGADGASLRVYADASAGLDPAGLKKGVAATFTGIAGQRASHKGALDGYRMWLRDAGDVTRTAAPSSAPSPSASPSPSPSPSRSGGVPAVESIATARVRDGASVTVQGAVTADRSLLDGTGRRTLIEDGTAAIELYLAAPDASIRLGARVRVTGVVGRAWGAPRLRAEKVTALGSAVPGVVDLRVAPGPATEWRLVRISGTVTSVHHTGDRWVAELDAGAAGTIPIVALAGAGIPADTLVTGHRATIVGIVKRPYPTASDRRYELLPRRPSDVTLGAAVATSPSPGASATTPAATTTSSGAPDPGTSGNPDGSGAPASDLRDLAALVGQRIQVGGVVTEATSDGFRLDDGTATARVALEGDAADLAAVVSPGDALDATGTVEDRDGLVVVVRDPADVVLVGDLGGEPESSASAAAAAPLVIDSTSPTLTLTTRAAKEPGSGAVAALVAALAIIAAAAALGARRLRDRRRLRARLHRRLAALRGVAAAPWSSGAAAAASAAVPSAGAADG